VPTTSARARSRRRASTSPAGATARPRCSTGCSAVADAPVGACSRSDPTPCVIHAHLGCSRARKHPRIPWITGRRGR
jgi:hypothetical protein